MKHSRANRSGVCVAETKTKTKAKALALHVAKRFVALHSIWIHINYAVCSFCRETRDKRPCFARTSRQLFVVALALFVFDALRSMCISTDGNHQDHFGSTDGNHFSTAEQIGSFGHG
jgi:hypothetical protein